MRLLFACEFYSPSVGGVQEVMKQLAERMVERGHQVTVVTSRLAERNFKSLNGVEIVGFDVAGNLVRGMHGDVDGYREFVRNFPCDAIMIKAAQQWTFDALWPVLDDLTCRKVFIPCGFSGLYEPTYQQYFVDLPDILRKWDHLIFYAEHYRDVDFARAHGLDQFTILPNGASEKEFEVMPDPGFRARMGIPESSFLMITVGSLTGMKGHLEVVRAFAKLKLRGGRHATLLLNGNEPPRPPVQAPPQVAEVPEPGNVPREAFGNRARRLARWPVHQLLRVARLGAKGIRSLRRDGVLVTMDRARMFAYDRLQRTPLVGKLLKFLRPAKVWSDMTSPAGWGIERWMQKVNKSLLGRKLAMHRDLPRDELVQAYFAADLFVFASNIEYSPLVLYEAAAAGTPFITVPVGNSEEIARWTGAGVVCPAPKDERGYTWVDPKVLASEIASLAADPARLAQLGSTGRQRWRDNFSWMIIAGRYEAILQDRSPPSHKMALKDST